LTKHKKVKDLKGPLLQSRHKQITVLILVV